MKGFIENTFNGLALLMLGKDLIDSSNAGSIWKDLYDVKCEEVIKLTADSQNDKMTLYNNHNIIMQLMDQNQGQLARIHDLEKALKGLVGEVESLGLSVDDQYTIIVETDPIDDAIDDLSE